MTSNIKTNFISISKKIINNKIINDNKLELDYNGNNLNINEYSNGKFFYTKLNNNDLVNIFKSKSPKIELKNRLFNKYYKNKKTHSKHKLKNKKIKNNKNTYKIKKSIYKNNKNKKTYKNK